MNIAHKLIIGVASILIIVFVSGYLYNLISYNYEHRILNTQRNLRIMRGSLLLFYENYGFYPNSLTDLLNKRFTKEAEVGQKTYEMKEIPKEYISKKNGSNKVSNILDGSGGWYYDKQNHTVYINLNKPIKYYLRYYRGKYSEERPSNW